MPRLLDVVFSKDIGTPEKKSMLETSCQTQ